MIEAVDQLILQFVNHSADPPKFQIVLSSCGVREKYPKLHQVEFKIRIVNKNGENILPPAAHVFCSENTELFSVRRSLKTPETSEIARRLQTMATIRDESAKLIIEVRIQFQESELLSIENVTNCEARPLPIELGCFFNLLTNSENHDFTLKTRHGESFLTSKEALFVSSQFFRRNLSPQQNEMTLLVDHLESIETAITYLLTNHYKPPTKMTPIIAKEVLQMVATMVRKPTDLKGSVEKHLFETILENRDDLEYLINVFRISKETGMFNIQSILIGIIISDHYLDFIRNHSENLRKPPNLGTLITNPLRNDFAILTTINRYFNMNQNVRKYVEKMST